jgi:histone H3
MARTKSAPKKIDASTAGEKRPHRWKPGTVALREIRRYQRSVDTVIPKSTLERVIRELAAEATLAEKGIRFRVEAIDAIHESAETYLVDVLRQAQVYAIHAGRTTILPRDLKLASSASPVAAG